jgi:asparagine synthase (glutamine-hydrolysing)
MEGTDMCGLAGRFHPVRLPDAPGWHARADELLRHRGPDGSGHWRDEHCELVHRRLAIIDLSAAGRQPMTNEDGDVLVVYNGEIYNHRPLRRDLERRGHRFRSGTDTEVLVHLYEECGPRLVERLHGIFAFAVFDRARRRLLLARDRFGVKPLFYAHDDATGQWVFASEIKAITALPGFHPRLDHQACYDFLSLGYVPEPATGLVEVRALPRGAALSVSPDGTQLDGAEPPAVTPDPARDLSGTVDELSRTLLRAVRRQAVADVPVAALLSGGIDSSLVVAAHGRATGGSTSTFSVRFPDPDHDETLLARAVADHCGARHHTIDARERRLAPDTLLDLLRHFDQPYADTSCIPMFWVATAVRERGIVCALSGDGGDEAFGGYSRFWRANRLMQLMRAPAWARRAAVGAGRALAAHTRDWGRQVAKAAQLAEAGRADAAVVLAGLSSYLTEEQKAELVLPEARRGLEPAARVFDGYDRAAVKDVEELSRRLTDTLFRVVLPSDMLRKVDMMSMRASVEVRVPLLDDDVVALGLSLPHRLKTDGRAGKLVPRALARAWLPPAAARHPKHGFTIPLDVMLPPAFHAAAADLLTGPGSRTREFLDRRPVESWLAGLASAKPGGTGGEISREGRYQRVFMLLSLELWLRDRGLSW